MCVENYEEYLMVWDYVDINVDLDYIGFDGLLIIVLLVDLILKVLVEWEVMMVDFDDVGVM